MSFAFLDFGFTKTLIHWNKQGEALNCPGKQSVSCTPVFMNSSPSAIALVLDRHLAHFAIFSWKHIFHKRQTIISSCSCQQQSLHLLGAGYDWRCATCAVPLVLEHRAQSIVSRSLLPQTERDDSAWRCLFHTAAIPKGWLQKPAQATNYWV